MNLPRTILWILLTFCLMAHFNPQAEAQPVVLKLATRHRRGQFFYVRRESPDGEPSPSKALRRGERFDRLQEAINRLRPDYREALMLVRIEGLKIKEAARRMNRSPKAILHLVARALKRLKEAFGDTESLHLPPMHLEGGNDAN